VIQVLFWSAVVRVVQAAVEAAPTVIVGILVTAIFQRVLGRENTFTVFGGRTWRQIPQAWAMGMLLPVCSLGAIPIMTELRKAGLIGGTILAFGLTAPIFNPLSVLYGLTLSHPMVIFTICMASLALVTIMGLFWDRVFKNEFIAPEPMAPTPYGLRRVASVFLAMIRIAYSRDSLYMLIGVSGVAMLSMVLAANSLQQSAESDDWTAPLKMAGVALPAYVTPMSAMVQLATMFQHGNSIAAAFTLLILGTGLNLGMVFWIGKTYQWKKAFVWIGVAVLLVLVIAYAIEKPLYPEGVKSEGHTHAFDQFCRPIANDSSAPMTTAKTLIYDSTPAFAGYSLAIYVTLLFLGAVAYAIDPKQTWEQRLSGASPGLMKPEPMALATGEDFATDSLPTVKSNRLNRDIVIPPKVTGLIAIGGLVWASVYGCYIYYPKSPVVYEQLQVANAEVTTRVMSKDWAGAMYWIPTVEDWLRKLQVGMYLRGESLSEEQFEQLDALLHSIEELEDYISDEKYGEATSTAKKFAYDYFRFRQSTAMGDAKP
jgi:uncharacterized membrane protein YraQ (UPF0718 family)